MKTILKLIVLSVLLAACTKPGTTPTPPAPIESPLATPVSPIATPGSLPAPSEASDAVLPPGVAIVLRRSGGLAGRSDQWTIYADGRVLSGDGASWSVAPERIGALIAQLDEVGFFGLSGSYVPEDTCCDRFLYELVVAGERTHSITVLEAERDIPPGAWQAVDAVSAFIAETSGQ